MQFGEPNENPMPDDDGGDEDERFMYFIRTGEFEVTIESYFNVGSGPNSGPDISSTRLYDGDHFGEIGLIYNLKRTATVSSKNYGSLAKLTHSGLEEIYKTFPQLERFFKYYIFKYSDKLRAFLEMEMDKITYFRPLE